MSLKSGLIIILLIFCYKITGQKLYNVEGFITDKNTREALIGANVYIHKLNKGVVSDEKGFYSLSAPNGTYLVTVSLIGYKTDTIQIEINNNAIFNFELIEIAYDIESVIFKGEKNKNIDNTDIGTIKLNSKDFNTIPTLFGEKDPVKILQLTPGIQSSKEGFGGIYIRGGGPDQNLFLLDDAIAYNPSHLFGFFSVFNSDIIDNLKVVKAGMPAEYGNRLASVIEINTIDGDYNKTHSSASIGLLSSKALINGPIIKEKISYYLAARRTYIDLLLRPFKKQLENSSSFFSTSLYYFYDLNGKISYKLNLKNTITITGYMGNDNYDFKRKTYNFNSNIDWGNKLASLKWNHVFNENFYMKNVISATAYNFGFLGNQTTYGFEVNSYIQNYSAKNKFTLLKNNHLFIFGAEYTRHKVRPTEQYAHLNETKINFSDQNIYFGNEMAFFASDNFEYRKLRFNLGIRFTNYTQVGPFEKYITDFEGNIEDSIVFIKNEKIKNYKHFEPRISIRYLLNDISSLKIAYTQNYQYIHISPISTVSLPTDIWILSTKIINPQNGVQVSGGYYRNITCMQNQFEFSLEAYYKNFKNLIEFTRNVFNEYSETVEDRLYFGKGESYGTEIFLKKNTGSIKGWIGYTLSKSLRQFDEINFGNPFHAKYDRPHDFSVLGTYTLKENLNFSAVFVYATGNAYTIPISRYLIEGNLVNLYGEINSFRLPPYHRLDVSLTYKKYNNNKEITWDFSIYNLYNHKNPYYAYYEIKGSADDNYIEVSPKIVTLFPILPSISWSIKF